MAEHIVEEKKILRFVNTGFRVTHEFQWYQTYERGYETSGSPLRFMLRRSSLVECVVCYTERVYNAQNFFYPSVCAAMFV